MLFAEINKEGIRKLPFAIVSLDNGTFQPPLIREKGFPYHQILWVVEGTCTYRIGNEVFTLSSGEGIYMKPNVPHSYEGKGLHTAWCTFAVSDGLFDFLGVGDYLYFKSPSSLKTDTEQLLKLCLGDSTMLERSSAGYTFVTEFFAKVLGERESFSSAVDRILERRYTEQISLDDIAIELGVDRFSLCRRYKKEKGTTVVDELNRIRLQKAKQFLKYNASSIEEIGKMCGFESHSYFGKLFRENVGCTPSEYRKNKKG